MVQVWSSTPRSLKSDLTRSLTTEAGDYPAIYESLAEAIRKNDQSVYAVTPEQAVLNIRIIEAGFQSSKEGRTITL